ncbi:flippase [Streptococcus gallolyticus]|uniref:flippase n=2 Tax=Streptococcus gallolyticus TaxID=315405 RepID=UPI0022837D2C|nr:flippase [Streptococcus gallolyticus]
MRLLKNYLYNMSYQVIAIILPLITVPYISRVLGSEAVGINSYTNAIITYFVLIANIGLTVYGNRAISYTRDSIYQRSQKFWEIACIKWVMALISFVLLMFFIKIYGRYSNYLLWQSIQIVATAFDISWFFTGLEDFKKTVTRNIVVKVLSAVLILLLVKEPKDLSLYIIIVASSTLFGNLTLWTYLKKLVIPVDFQNFSLKSHIIPVFTLFIPQLANQLFMTLNKLMLGNLSTISQTGYFDNSDKIVRILLTAITAVGTVIFPRLANSFKNNNTKNIEKYLKLSFDMVTLISIPVSFGIISISQPFSNIYFGADFSGINLTLSVLVIELIFMGWSTVFGNQFLVAINKVKGLTVSVVVGTLFLLGSSLILIPKLGSVGAAITSVIGELTIATVQLLFVKKYIKLKVIFGDFYKFLLSGLLMLIICLLVGNTIDNDYLNILVQVFCGGATYLISLFILKPRIINIKEVRNSFLD